MSNVPIRDVSADDLEQIRSAAAAQGSSLQSYLLATVRAQAAYLRRQAVLAKTAQRIHDNPAVPEDERAAVLDRIDAAHQQRADQLCNRPEK